MRALTEQVDRDAIRAVFHAVGPRGFAKTVTESVQADDDPDSCASELADELERIGDSLQVKAGANWLRIANAVIDNELGQLRRWS
jgi:hypothetical protein